MSKQASQMLRDLRAADHMVAAMDASAPVACAAMGGASGIVRDLPGRPTAAGFWVLDMRGHVEVWERMAAEQQEEHRVGRGE